LHKRFKVSWGRQGKSTFENTVVRYQIYGLYVPWHCLKFIG
jgi:hypothetical protein